MAVNCPTSLVKKKNRSYDAIFLVLGSISFDVVIGMHDKVWVLGIFRAFLVSTLFHLFPLLLAQPGFGKFDQHLDGFDDKLGSLSVIRILTRLQLFIILIEMR